MSRIGKMPVAIPKGVEVKADTGNVRVKGPKGELVSAIPVGLSVAVADGQVKIARANDEPHTRACHGLLRSLVANSCEGVTKGFSKELEISGVGFKAEVKGKDVHFTLGFSHPVVFKLPEGITAEVDAKQTKITVKGVDKHLLGLTAAKIRALRPPEPYKGKGIKYAEETIRRKEGKTGAA